jgi:hypothetical protein
VSSFQIHDRIWQGGRELLETCWLLPKGPARWKPATAACSWSVWSIHGLVWCVLGVIALKRCTWSGVICQRMYEVDVVLVVTMILRQNDDSFQAKQGQERQWEQCVGAGTRWMSFIYRGERCSCCWVAWQNPFGGFWWSQAKGLNSEWASYTAVKDAAAAGLLDRIPIRIWGFWWSQAKGLNSQLGSFCKVLALIFKTGRKYCSTTNLPRFKNHTPCPMDDFWLMLICCERKTLLNGWLGAAPTVCHPALSSLIFW